MSGTYLNVVRWALVAGSFTLLFSQPGPVRSATAPKAFHAGIRTPIEGCAPATHIPARTDVRVRMSRTPVRVACFVADRRGQVGCVDLESGTTSVLARMPQWLTDIAVDRDGTTIWGITAGRYDLCRIDTRTGAFRYVGRSGHGLIGLVMGSTGELLAAGGDRLYRLNRKTGEARELMRFGRGVAGDLAFGPDGKLYVTTRDGWLMKLAPATCHCWCVAYLGFHDLLGLVYEPRRGALLAFRNGGEVCQIDPATGAIRPVTQLAGPIRGCTGAAMQVVWHKAPYPIPQPRPRTDAGRNRNRAM